MRRSLKLFAAILAIMLIPACFAACGKNKESDTPVFLLDKTSVELTVGGNIEVLTLNKENVEGTLEWTSSNKNVATVAVGSEANKATVRGISEGGAVITAKAGSYTAICTVIVKRGLYLTLEKEDIELFAGRTAQITPSTNITTPLTYSSSNEDVARVSSTGLVSAVSSGSAVITVSGGAKSARCYVTVIDPSVTLSAQLVQLTLNEGEDTFKLGITTNSTGKVTVESSDESVATIDDSGLITAVGKGETTITVTYRMVEATCVVKVKDEILSVTFSEGEEEITERVLPSGESFTLSAAVSNKDGAFEGEDAAVTWSVVKGGDIVSVENGTVTSLGKYGTATVRATSVKDPDAYADFTVTVPDPYGDWIQISDRASLENALKSGNENKNMYLTCDIDLGGAELNSTIGYYTGTFEGRGYEIKNFSCSNGLFGGITASAVITDLAITCRSGKQSGDVHKFEGLFGQFILGRMENCRFDVTVLQDSQSALVHHSDPNATIKNVILLVRNPQNKNEIFPCFFLEATCENVYCAVVEGNVTGAMNGAQPKTEAQLKEASLYAGWDSDVWLIEDGEIPVLQNDNTGVRIGISQKEATVYTGETLALTATVRPDKLPLEEKGVIWTSSNESVATVDGNGVVTALKAGTAVITATSEKDPAKFATCTITVNAVELSINSEDIEMKRGATKQLSATVNHGGYIWVSSNESIATVEDGLVRAVGDGTVTITVRSLLDNSVTDSITITVKATINLSVTLSDSTLTLDRDDSATLTATVKGSDSGVSWTSSDESVASVDENGVVTSHGKNGTAIITAITIEDNGAGDHATAKCTVTVEYVAAEITVEETAFTLPLGGALTLADIATASKGEFALSLKGGSSDGIVSLGSDTITAVSEGEVTVLLTWSIDYADIKDEVYELSITVFVPAVELSINAERLALKAGESSNARILQVTMDVMPASPKAEDITWTSGDSSVVEVASAGYANGSYTATLNAKGEGITVITATYTIGGIDYKVTCSVAVFNAAGSWTAVYDLNSFKQVWGTPGNYYLAHDLDLNGATVDRTREDYNAVFDGRGFTVSNFTTKSLFMYNNTGSVIENVKLVCTLNNNGANEGIFGHHGNGGIIKNCYIDVTFGTNLAAISPALMNHINNAIYENVIVATHNPNQKSGVRADFFEAGGTVTNMICYREDNSIIAPQKGTAKTEAQLKTAATFEGWDGWVATDGEYPRIRTDWDS